MCGRYGLFHEASEIAASFRADIARLDPPLAPRFDVAPTALAPVVVHDGNGREARYARWGLIPHWVRDAATFRATLFNARSETAHAKPSFRDAMRKDRCLVPVSGFYEWTALPEGGKRRWWIRRQDGGLLALAGLHARRDDRDPPDSFTVLTTAPNALLRQLHDRQPVILPAGTEEVWLDPNVTDPQQLADLLAPIAPTGLEAVPVESRVPRTAAQAADAILPLGPSLQVS